MKDVIVFNFTGAYENQDLYRNPDFCVIECKDIEGTNGYCDDEAAGKIRERFKEVSLNGVHFIDAGNYHYLSKFMVERIDEPFTLVVFDHHSDMKESEFFGLLSCGSWILDVVNTNDMVKRVVLVGISEEQKEMIPDVNKEIIVYTDEEIRNMSNVKIPLDCPIYISVDKDVLDETELKTTWDQGIMTKDEFFSIFKGILESGVDIVGVDICGEAEYHFGVDEDDVKNQEFNNMLVRLISGEESEKGD